MSILNIEAAITANRCELAVSGEVDVSSAAAISNRALLHLGEHRVAEIVIDLHGVTFIDSAGLGALLVVGNAAQDAGKTLVLRRPSPRVANLLQASGLASRFTIRP